jgi:hypothetical protein
LGSVDMHLNDVTCFDVYVADYSLLMVKWRVLLLVGHRLITPFCCVTNVLLHLKGPLAVQLPAFIQRSVGPSALLLASCNWWACLKRAVLMERLSSGDCCDEERSLVWWLVAFALRI